MKAFLVFLIYVLLVWKVNYVQAKNTTDTYSCLQQQAPPYDSLRQVLEEIFDTDQGIRSKLGAAKGDELNKLVGQMLQIDSVNQIQIKAILQQHGWLSRSKVGEKAADAIFFVVQHSNIPLMKQYLPSLQKLARQKEASPIHAAMMEDRLLMWEGKKQIYGTQGYSTTTRKPFIWPIQNPAKVNELRKKVGFEQTVEEYAKQMNAFYDPNEQLPPADK